MSAHKEATVNTMRKPPHFITRRWLSPEERFTLRNGSHNERFQELKNILSSACQNPTRLLAAIRRPVVQELPQTRWPGRRNCPSPWFTVGWPVWRDVYTSIPAVTVCSFARRLILSSATIKQASLKGQLVLPPPWYVCCTDLSRTHTVCSHLIF